MREKWIFSRITDYFDYNSGAIYKYSEEIAMLSPEEQDKVYEAISSHITAAVDWFFKDYSIAVQLTLCIVNDLYRTANSVTTYSVVQANYLNNTAKVFMQALTEHGVSVHFGSNNSFESLEALSALFPRFFNDSGLMYIDGYHVTDIFLEGNYEYIDEAFEECQDEIVMQINRVLAELNTRNRHYIVLLPDCDDSCFEAMLSTIEQPGYINIFKQSDACDASIECFPSIEPEKGK